MRPRSSPALKHEALGRETFSVAIDNHAYADPTRSILAEALLLGQKSTAGTLFTQALSDKGSQHGALLAFVLPPTLPSASPVTPGTGVFVAPKMVVTSLTAGAYGAVTVEQQATLRLVGGRYQLASLTIQQGARVEALSAVELWVAGRVDAGQQAYLGPSAGSGLTAGAVRLEVSGANGGNGSATSGPAAVTFGQSDEVRALVLAPSGTLSLGENARAFGALFARDVDLREKARLQLSTISGTTPMELLLPIPRLGARIPAARRSLVSDQSDGR